MKIFYKKEFVDDDTHTNKYYFCGIRYLKKIWSKSFRETYLFKFRLSKHKYNHDDNDINISNVLYSPEKTIDIIIPVYNGYEYLQDLFESIKSNTDLPYHLFVINDASPDERVLQLLKHYKGIFKQQMELIDNTTNLGFVRTVNKALKQTSNHVALINTDVILPKNWASRLFYPIFNDDKVATVTPFSNCATIFSLPNIGDNTFDGDLEKTNKNLSRINPGIFSKLNFPTGVGFCMAMNKTAIKKVGFLDEIFYRGYGEENDWCQRAIHHGFYNTIAANLFVWHKHGASFGSEKLKLIEKNSKIITNRYPNYDSDVQKCIHNNKSYNKLRFVAQLLFFNAAANETQVWFDHCWGGGTDIYFTEQCTELKENSCIIRLQLLQTEDIKISYYYKNYFDSMIIQFDNLDDILSNLDINKIVLNNLAGWNDTAYILDYMHKLKLKKHAFVSCRGHDYAAVCPAIFMLNTNNKFCDIHDLSECKKCEIYNNVGKYHESWKEFFDNACDEVIVFSKSSKDIFSRLYPCCRNKIQVIPHIVPKYKKITPQKHDGINIGILGAINILKGRIILQQMGELLAQHPGVNIKIIGYADKHLKNIPQTGKYEPKDLPQILHDNDIDIIFIPSIVPETFSYTTHEAMSMGLPVACFNLGAQAEYVKEYKSGLIINEIDAEMALNKILAFVKKHQQSSSENKNLLQKQGIK